MNIRGAKTAMTVALHKPSLVANLISIDNAPIDAALKSDFGKYMQGMKKIEEAQVQKQSEADEILQAFEEVRLDLVPDLVHQRLMVTLDTGSAHSPIPAHEPGPLHTSTVRSLGENPPQIPHPPPHPRQSTRSHGRLPLQGPRDTPLREADAVRAGHQEPLCGR